MESFAHSLSLITTSKIEPICDDRSFLFVHLSVCAFCGVCGSVIILDGFRKLIFSATSILLHFRTLFAFCSFTFLSQTVCYLLLFLSCTVPSLSPLLIYVYFASTLTYNVQLISLLLLLLMRLNFTFRGSVHAIDNNQHSLRCIKFSFCLLLILQLLSSVFDTASPLTVCSFAIYLLMSWILVFVFVLKLQTLTVHTSRSMYDHSKMEMSMNSRRDSTLHPHSLALPLPLPMFTPNNSVIRLDKDHEDIIVPPPTVDNIERIPQHRRTLSIVICSKLKNSQQQKFLVDSAAKYVCLNCMTVSSTMLTILIVTLCGYLAERWRCAITLPMYHIDAFINIVCLWLTYKTSNAYYLKYCARMDSLCKSALVKVTSFRMIRLYGKQTANSTEEGNTEIVNTTRKHRVYTNSSVQLPETKDLATAGHTNTQPPPPAIMVVSASNSSANTNTVNPSAVEVVISVDDRLNDDLAFDTNEKHQQYLNHLHIGNANNASNGITPFRTRSPTQSSRTSRSSSIDVVYEEPVELHQDFVANSLPDTHVTVDHDSKPREQSLKQMDLQLALTEKLKHLSQNDSNLDE